MPQGYTYPTVNPNDVKGFAQAWDSNGIKMILDSTSLKFAVDFANVVLRSYVDDLAAKAYKIKQAKLAALQAEGKVTTDAVSTLPVEAPAPPAKPLVTLE